MSGIYIHIPFCRQACTYCNFHFSTSLRLKDELLQALILELEMQHRYLPDRKINTIYFGGGTPSILPVDDIMRLTDRIYELYDVENLDEFTLEANPDDLNISYLRQLRQTPVNRFSIGVQSFYEQDLRYMNRAHTAQEADYAIKAAQDAGFPNISIDLIYGTPGLSDNDWKDNLKKVKELQIPHFSSYALTVEEGTALHHAINKRSAPPVDNEQAAGQFEILMEQAAVMGYDHYEISNLALPGKYAVHNTNYWRGETYLGIGPSAHSFDGSSRQWNMANNARYIESLLRDKKLPYTKENTTPEQHLNEYIMTSLRTMWGCDLEKIAAKWGSDYRTEIMNAAYPFIEKKQLIAEHGKLYLTSQGKLFADHISGELFV